MSAFDYFVLGVWLLGCFQSGRLLVGVVTVLCRACGYRVD